MTKNIDFITQFKTGDPEQRFELMFSNYGFFPKVIKKLEAKIVFNIKADREYMRSKHRGELGVRVQTSNLSNETEDQAFENLAIKEAFNTGVIDIHTLNGLDDVAAYEEDIRTVRKMKIEFQLLQDMIENLEDEDTSILVKIIVEKKYMKEVAIDLGICRDSLRKRFSELKEDLRNEMIDIIVQNERHRH